MDETTRKKLLSVEYPALTSPSEKERAAAFTAMVKETRRREVNYLRNKHTALPEHLVEEIVGEAFRLLWRKIETGDETWREKWTWNTFRRGLHFRGLDEYKKRSRARDRFGEHQSKVVTTTDDLEIYGATAPRLVERERQSALLGIAAAVISQLPVQQRRVAEILRDNRDAKIGPKEVIELYRKAHGVRLTPAAAKSSMSVVRAKLRAALAQGHAE